MAESVIEKQQGNAEGAAQLEVLEHLLKPEAQQALITLADQLPKIAEMMTLLTSTYDFAQKVATDRVLIQDTMEGIKEVVRPIEEKVKFIASAAIEAEERAEKDTTVIGLFGMMRMLKDPEIQKMLRFSQAYLDIVAERKQEK